MLQGGKLFLHPVCFPAHKLQALLEKRSTLKLNSLLLIGVESFQREGYNNIELLPLKELPFPWQYKFNKQIP